MLNEVSIDIGVYPTNYSFCIHFNLIVLFHLFLTKSICFSLQVLPTYVGKEVGLFSLCSSPVR